MTSQTAEVQTPEAQASDAEAFEAESPEIECPETEAPEAEAAEDEGAADIMAEDSDEDAEEEDSAGDEEAEEDDAVAAEAEAEDEDEDDNSEAADFDNLRLVEALLFASAEPLAPAQLARFLPDDVKLEPLLADLQALYANRGVNLVKRGGRWAFRTAEDLAPRMELENKVVRKLSRVALETLAVIAYHQPVTRAEIEEIRGVALSKGTLDALLEIGWIRPKGRRKTPGRPVTWGTSDAFLDHFGLEGLDALPGVEELKAAGLLDTRPALTALSDRGLLPAAGEVAPEESDEEEDEDESEIIEGSEQELLEATFGEDMLPREVEAAESGSEDADQAGADSADDGATGGAGDEEEFEDEVLEAAEAEDETEETDVSAGGAAEADFDDALPEMGESDEVESGETESDSESEGEPRRNTG